MDLISSRTGSADADPDLDEEPGTDAGPDAEVRRLRRELRRERARRRAAEAADRWRSGAAFGDPDTVRELGSGQAHLLDLPDEPAVAAALHRALGEDLASGQVVTRAAASAGRAVDADRCDVLPVDAGRYSAVQGTWSSSPAISALPRVASFVDLPEGLAALLIEAAQRSEPLRVDDVGADDRVDGESVVEIREALGMRAVAAVPLAVGDEVVGWMLVESVSPRAWHPRELAACAGIAHDLVSSLVRLQALHEQRESMQRLRELDRAKDAFVSTVSHELRTPLTSIVGHLELLAENDEESLPPHVASGLAVIERNVTRLHALVEDLLMLSAYDAEVVRPERRPLDLAEVVRRAHLAVAPLAAEQGVEVKVVAPPRLPPVQADRAQLERAVDNLLGNAVKFTRAGGRATATVSLEESDVVLTVTDTGIGIPAADQERLFTRFFRSSLSVAEEIQGAGLGLSLVRTVVDWHGGTVEVSSVEGEGTTVTVRLPRRP